MSTTSGAGLRGFWANLSTEGRWLLSTVAIQTVGRGLTLPFTIIYLHEVRGISLDLAGLSDGVHRRSSRSPSPVPVEH